MRKKSLFNKYEAYNTKGGELGDEVSKALDPIIKKWADKGYAVKDIESIATDCVFMTSAIERATRAMKLRKEEIAEEKSITPEQVTNSEIISDWPEDAV